MVLECEGWAPAPTSLAVLDPHVEAEWVAEEEADFVAVNRATSKASRVWRGCVSLFFLQMKCQPGKTAEVVVWAWSQQAQEEESDESSWAKTAPGAQFSLPQENRRRTADPQETVVGSHCFGAGIFV